MSIIDNEVFLPGVVTEVEADYSYGYDSSQFGTTDSVMISGTAFSGPVGMPVEIYSPEHARYVFGGTFDPVTKKEATLVAGIEDAYQRGGRTIYAVRVSGKEISRNFDFNLNSHLKLQVRSSYPTNEAKDYFLQYDNREGNETIKIIKPSSRATVVEKMQGKVESEMDMIVLSLKVNNDYGLTKNDPLPELIRIVNEHPYNNVLRLAIVDRDGADVTDHSIDARSLPIGALFPGVYFIGRDRTHIPVQTDIDYKVIYSDVNRPYENFEGLIHKELILNTDLNNELPIFAKDNKILADSLKDVNVFTSKPFDFLETLGIADRAFAKNKVDYEEVDISDFELYKRLGSGFAITARAEARKKTSSGSEPSPRVRETPPTDVNRVAELRDGIYSMLENHHARYRVLTCANADEPITGRLPRAKDFAVSKPIDFNILEDLINVTPRVDKDDHTIPKRYQFQIRQIEGDEDSVVDSIDSIYSEVIVPTYARKRDGVNGVVKDGTTLAVKKGGDTLEVQTFYDNIGKERANVGMNIPYGASGGSTASIISVEEELYISFEDSNEYKKATEDEISNLHGFSVNDHKHIMIESEGNIYAATLNPASDGSSVKLSLLGDIEVMFDGNEDKTIIFVQSNYYEVNDIVIQSTALDAMTLEEFVEFLNENNSISPLFDFQLTNEGYLNKDDYLTEIQVIRDNEPITLEQDLLDGIKENLIEQDRVSSYDYNMYIPYKTTDNFARQLAQHCTYTSLKTAPTHGIIGTRTLRSSHLNSIKARVNELINHEYDLYAKTAEGKNMLDRNNMPYSIGKNISITGLLQYPVYMSDGYSVISNGASGYAGMVSTLPLDQSSTNQPIRIPSLSFELSQHQLTRLTQKGYVTSRESFTKGLVVTDGITMAPAESPFRRLNVARIASFIEQLIREASEPFIGKQNHAANRNSLHTAIKSKLEDIKDTLIEAYEFNLVVDPSIAKFAYIDIDYNIVPIYEIREVRNRVKMKDEL